MTYRVRKGKKKKKNTARKQRDITGTWRPWIKIWHQAFTNSVRKRHSYNNNNLEIKTRLIYDVKWSYICRRVEWLKESVFYRGLYKSGPTSASMNIEQMSLYSDTEVKRLNKQVLLTTQLCYDRGKFSFILLTTSSLCNSTGTCISHSPTTCSVNNQANFIISYSRCQEISMPANAWLHNTEP